MYTQCLVLINTVSLEISEASRIVDTEVGFSTLDPHFEL